MKSPRILFLCKRNANYGFVTKGPKKPSGLYNSTRFIVESLVKKGVHAEIVTVEDNNCIDRVVTEHRPDIVVLEALWVVPSKFPVLMRLHPNVKWFCHLHSHMPFLAQEGMSLEWLIEYQGLEVGLIANSPESHEALRVIAPDITFLPNVYLSEFRAPHFHSDKGPLDIACFGAIRPLKNHLLQALAAIKFARALGKPLRFHINGTRVETGGAPVLKNLRKLFEALPDAVLVEAPWLEPAELLDYLHFNIDIGMQVSLTETFNVVSADYVTAGIPIVVSKEIKWASRYSRAADDDLDDIVSRLRKVWRNAWQVRLNQYRLGNYARKAERAWLNFVMGVAGEL